MSTDAVIIIAGGGQGRGGAQLAHNKHMLHCVRQEHFTYTQTIRCVVSFGSGLVCLLPPVCMCPVSRPVCKDLHAVNPFTSPSRSLFPLQWTPGIVSRVPGAVSVCSRRL